MKKRIVSLLLVIFLIFSQLPIMSFAEGIQVSENAVSWGFADEDTLCHVPETLQAEAAQAEPIPITKLNVGGVNALRTPTGNGWSFDKATATLTLNNANISTRGAVEGIVCTGDLTIVLKGSNTITNTVVSDRNGNQMAPTLVVEGSLVIQGETGSKLITRTPFSFIQNGGYSIYSAGGDLTITGCSIDANSSIVSDAKLAVIDSVIVQDTLTSRTEDPLFVGLGGTTALTVENSDITICNAYQGLYEAKGNTQIVDSTIQTQGCYMGIVAVSNGGGSVRIERSNLNLQGGAYGILLDNPSLYLNDCESITIQNSMDHLREFWTLQNGNIPYPPSALFSRQINIENCADVTISGTLFNMYSEVSQIKYSSVTAHGGAVGSFGNLYTTDSTVSIKNTQAGIDAYVNLTGGVDVHFAAIVGNVVHFYSGSDVVAEGVLFGVSCEGNVLAEYCDVEFRGGLHAVMAQERFAVSNANVSAELSWTDEERALWGYEGYPASAIFVPNTEADSISFNNVAPTAGEIGIYNSSDLGAFRTILGADGKPLASVQIVDPSSVIPGGTCGENLSWTLSGDGVLTISGEGAMTDFEKKGEPWREHLNSITTVKIDHGVTSIGDWAFFGYSNVTEISIPPTVTRIGEAALAGLGTMEKLVIPEGVVIIEEGALQGSRMQEIVIPASVEFIGNSQFMNCPNLSFIRVDEGNAYYSNDSNGFLYNKDKTKLIQVLCTAEGAFVIPETVITIGETAMAMCQYLTGVTVPASVTTIEQMAFAMCSVQEIIFEGDAPAFGEYVFANSALTAFFPENNPTWTEDVMQQYGGSITWVSYVPDTVASGTCGDNLTWELDADGVLVITGEGAMNDFNSDNTPWIDYQNQICAVVLEEGVTRVGACAFATCVSLTEVILPESLTSIGEAAFFDCISLAEIDLPGNLQTIDIMAFANCDSFTAVLLPANVASIGDGAFGSCDNLIEFQVDEGNTNFYSWEGLLYQMNILLQVPGAYTGALELHEYTHKIANMAAIECTGITELSISANTQEIGSQAFAGCTNLTEIIFRGDEPAIAGDAFGDVVAVVSRPAGNPLWTEDMYRNYRGTLTWTTYGDDLVATGYCGENDKVIDVDGQITLSSKIKDGIPGKNASWTLTDDGTLTISGIGRMTDCDFTGNHPWYAVCVNDDSRITKLVVEENITYVGWMNFLSGFGGQYITEVVLPSTLKEMGYYAFSFMSSLEKINIPDGVTTLSECVLGECPSLTEIVIPASVTAIETNAFYNDSGLTKIQFCGDAPAVKADAFTGVTAIAVYPRDNATWTEAAMQNYGGAITWTPTPDPCELGNHLFTNYISDYNGTCSSDGTKTAMCDRGCGAIDTVADTGSLNPDAHSFDEWVSGNNQSQRTCSLCGLKETKTTTAVGDVTVESTEDNDLIFKIEHVDDEDSRFDIVEEAFADKPEDEATVVKTFDITLEDEEGTPVQPEGTVTVSLPLDSEQQEGNFKVYRVNDDGTLTDMGAKRQGDQMVFETDHFSIYVLVAVAGYDITGTVTSSGDETAEITIQLIDSSEAVAYSTTVVGNNAAYALNGVMEGTYTLKATKTGHAVTTCTVTVGAENVTQDITLWQIGDVNSDGKVNSIDRVYLARYLAKWKDYPESVINMDAADVNGDDTVNSLDRVHLARHLAKWTGYETLGG